MNKRWDNCALCAPKIISCAPTSSHVNITWQFTTKNCWLLENTNCSDVSAVRSTHMALIIVLGMHITIVTCASISSR